MTYFKAMSLQLVVMYVGYDVLQLCPSGRFA